MADSDVVPFQVSVSDEELADLRDRLLRTRWPERETVDDWSQGIPLAYMKEICDYWADQYDWRTVEGRLNAFPQVRTVVDGLGIHVLHARSPEPTATPLLMTHGWPGSLVEFLDVLGPMTDPVAHGGKAADAFHVVCPSLPGFGFSDKPSGRGWDTERMADAWAEIMSRLGYDTFVAQGGDFGALVSHSLALRHPDRVIGVHLSSPNRFPDAQDTAETEQEREALERVQSYVATEAAYWSLQSTRPQTVGYGLVDSPVGQAAWILEKLWAWTDYDKDISEVLSRDQLLDNVMMYWLPGSGASSGRAYWEGARASVEVSSQRVEVPMGMSVHPKDITRLSRRWVEREYEDIRYWNEVARGGHFGAFEQPAQFVDEIRAYNRALR
jgi:pimeloyl-ACP methyl ester carboxylesterase